MQTKHAAGVNDSGTTDSLTRSLGTQCYSAIIGTDGEGYKHHFWRDADTVVVFDADGVDHVEYLDGRVLADWARYVARERGWARVGPLMKPIVAADRERKEAQ